MKFFVFGLLFIMTSVSFAADSKVFTAKDSGGVAEYPCAYSRGGICDPDQVEAELKDKCYRKGFVKCETLVKRRSISHKSDIFCGHQTNSECIVTIRGTNE